MQLLLSFKITPDYFIKLLQNIEKHVDFSTYIKAINRTYMLKPNKNRLIIVGNSLKFEVQNSELYMILTKLKKSK